MGLFSKLTDLIFSNRTVLHPESNWIVSFDDEAIRTIDFQKREGAILFSEIETITILTNDSGPGGIDLWWRIEGNGKSVLIPGGATGELQLLKKLQELPNFDNEEFNKSMVSTDNREFLIWAR